MIKGLLNSNTTRNISNLCKRPLRPHLRVCIYNRCRLCPWSVETKKKKRKPHSIYYLLQIRSLHVANLMCICLQFLKEYWTRATGWNSTWIVRVCEWEESGMSLSSLIFLYLKILSLFFARRRSGDQIIIILREPNLRLYPCILSVRSEILIYFIGK